MGPGAASGQPDMPQRRRLFFKPYCAEGGVGGSSPRVLTAGRVSFFRFGSSSGRPCRFLLSLRNRQAVIVEGPPKVHQVPFLIGPSNSGKTTLVQPLETLFGSTRLFHKPTLNAGFPLANLVKGKRFIFFDDYRPIEYCQSTIDLPTFLSLFQGAWLEIKQSQAFSNGYADYRWQKGVCMAAKDEKLWVPYGLIGPEEVAHIQNRLC